MKACPRSSPANIAGKKPIANRESNVLLQKPAIFPATSTILSITVISKSFLRFCFLIHFVKNGAVAAPIKKPKYIAKQREQTAVG